VEEVLNKQLKEKENEESYEKLEAEIVSLRKELTKLRIIKICWAKNLRAVSILSLSPRICTCLGYFTQDLCLGYFTQDLCPG